MQIVEELLRVKKSVFLSLRSLHGRFRRTYKEKEMATHSSILAWGIPWTEDHGRLQSLGLQRVRHDSATNTIVTAQYDDSINIYTLYITKCLPQEG